MIKFAVEGIPQELRPDFVRALIKEKGEWPYDHMPPIVCVSDADVLIEVSPEFEDGYNVTILTPTNKPLLKALDEST